MTAALRRLILAFGLVGALMAAPAAANAASGQCSGHFVNPITDVCWGCLFPLTIGSIPLFKGSHADTPNPSSPICLCQAPPPLFVKVGLSVGFWEPVRLEDVTNKAWCFPNLGGISFNTGIGYATKSHRKSDGTGDTSGYHVHYYVYPVMYWMELLTDFLCLERMNFDVAYVTELDPLWQDDQLSTLINPEALIFSNPIAVAACTADCALASTTGQGSKSLFWCAGCQGTMFPLTGNVAGEYGRVQGGLLAGERMLFKLHRQLLAQGTSGPAAVCEKYAMPIMDKRQYRMQIVNPNNRVPGPFQCPAVGATTIPWEGLKNVPVVGEDQGYLIWRKRNCCVGI